MSIPSRFISGSLAAWAKILVTVLTQLALVPIYLSHWDVETYGCWLVIQSVASFASIFSLAHHNYVGNTILQITRRDPAQIRAVFSSALPFSLALGLAELSVLVGLVLAGKLDALFDPEQQLPAALLHDATLALLVMASGTYLGTTASGLYNRVANAHGHFPRTAWWGVGMALANAIGSALLVVSGQDLLTTVTGGAALNLVMYVVYQFDLWKISQRHQIFLIRPEPARGFANLMASTQLGITFLLGLLRQQGLRMLVSSHLGVAQAAAFSTMRTASNVAQQGLATVTEPVFPEFMGFLRDRRQPAMAGTMGFVWLAAVFALGPAMVLLQSMAPWLFDVWTRGKVLFDPWVFGLFSVGMLVFGLSRPADQVVYGNNLMKVQMGNAAVLAGGVVLGILWLDGRMGLRGIAAVLLIAELVNAAVLVYWAGRWLADNQLQWPRALLLLASAEVLLCTAGILLVAGQPQWRAETTLSVLAGTATLLAVFVARFPPQQKAWLRQRVARFVPVLRAR